MTAWPTGDISFYNLAPPNRVRLSTIPGAAVKRWDDSVLVFDVRIGDGIVRTYSFTEHWFEVHCTFDLDGHLRPEPGPVNWAFDCDMCTPAIIRGNDVYNVDLKLDILVEPDGVTYALVDEDDFAEARSAGWLTDVEVLGARRGADELIGIILDVGLGALPGADPAVRLGSRKRPAGAASRTHGRGCARVPARRAPHAVARHRFLALLTHGSRGAGNIGAAADAGCMEPLRTEVRTIVK